MRDTRENRKVTTMKKIILASVALAVLSGAAFGKSEVQVTRTIWELSDFPALAEKAKAVCEGKGTLSDKLKVACKDGNFPKVTKAGLFRNTGIGAELNTLMRQ
jgi:hypothetical protein